VVGRSLPKTFHLKIDVHAKFLTRNSSLKQNILYFIAKKIIIFYKIYR